MVDTSHIDLASLIEQKAGIRLGKPYGNGEGRTRKGPCPFCRDGKDRFAVFINGDRPHYFCGIHGGPGCHATGDAITFLEEWDGKEFSEACEELGIALDGAYTASPYVHKAYDPEFLPQTKKWSTKANEKLSKAQALIHTGPGLAYARGRGLTDGTILDWHLGYIPFRNYETEHFFQENPDEWGVTLRPDKKMYLYEGLVIPWYINGKIWKLQVRRVAGKINPKFKILPIKGSVEHCMFNQGAIAANKPVVLVESALCAISGNQEAGDLATFVATGGSGGNQYDHNVLLLAKASVVLVAFDNDENQAGDKGAEYWKENLPNAFRWPPWGHDINDMLVREKDIRAWVEVGLAAAELEQAEEATVFTPPTPQQEERLVPSDVPSGEEPITQKCRALIQVTGIYGTGTQLCGNPLVEGDQVCAQCKSLQSPCSRCGGIATHQADTLAFCRGHYFAYESEKIESTAEDKALLALLEERFSNSYGHEMNSFFTNGEMLRQMHERVYGPFNDRWGLRWFREYANQLHWKGQVSA